MTAPAPTPSHPTINWTALRRRLEGAHALFDQERSPSVEHRNAVLRARARAAAVESTAMRTEDARLELVEFSLLHETYGIEAAYVREVACLDSYLPLPGAPAFVLGIIPLRGRMLTIVNLKPFFDLPDQGLTNLNKIIVLEDGPTEFGLLTDSVSGSLRHVLERSLQAPPPTLTGPRAQFSRGVTPDALIVLDAPRLLRDPRFDAGTA